MCALTRWPLALAAASSLVAIGAGLPAAAKAPDPLESTKAGAAHS